ncbi:anion exchange protein 4 isoform X15 [Homo sapiens]|uniref:anion exchange protein 4 isoform X15 n=1 Tax=Homo sapiens TaxID=9606 RepID=UPI001FB1690C|nr:anion exchange protein 4 isoform X15 [Homo sapiens]XP_054209580.1 anion exchange protein 4 isoform X15 [Homo sapiens]
MEMKLPGQEGFEASSAPRNIPSGELDSNPDPGTGPSPDGPSDTESKELGVPKDPLLFIQLNELLGWPQALEWRETGRWVLFEEKLEVAAGRWSAPHVPTLALPSLQKLRSLLAEGLVLLDCPAQSLLELVGSTHPRKASDNEEAPLREQCQNPLRQKLPPGAEAGTVLAGELGFLAQPLGAFVRLRNPVVLGSLTEVSLPSRFFCLLLGPCMLGKGYHEMGRAAAVLLSDPQFQWSVRRASNLHDLLAALDAFLEEVTVLPPGRWDPTARIPPPKCLPSQHKRLPSQQREIRGPAVPRLTSAEDRHRHGPHAHSPELQRTGRDYSLDYLPFRLWVGIWVATFCLVLVATEASVLVRYFTRFTEEGFCALISLIFIYDAVGKMLNLTHTYPIQKPGSSAYGCLCQYPGPGGNESQWIRTRPKDRDDIVSMDLGLINASLLPPPECTRQGGHPRGPGCHTVPDIAFFSLLLFLTSFFFAMALKCVKTSRFFPSVVRKGLSDFSSVLAILLGCGLDAFLGLATPKLMVPREFKPTLPGRGWLVSPFGANPWWWSVAAALPALLLSILIFMDQQITAVILNRMEYRLQKGAGFHLDLFCVAVLMLLTSALGLPWYVSATVISLAHMDSLRRESRACAPGERPNFLGIREQRLTGLVVFILTGASIFLAPVLKFIPMPVLYGIFLYMGVAALSSIQFTNRVKLLLMPAKHQPDLLLLRHVPLTRVHLFTAIQLACLGLLWIIKSTPAAIIFPLMLLGLVGVRKALERVFSPQELLWLDELMPEEERSIPEKGLEPEHSFSGSDSEDVSSRLGPLRRMCQGLGERSCPGAVPK